MKYEAWYIIDEDTNKIIKQVFGTKQQALKKLEELSEARQPGDKRYWNVWSLFRRVV